MRPILVLTYISVNSELVHIVDLNSEVVVELAFFSQEVIIWLVKVFLVSSQSSSTCNLNPIVESVSGQRLCFDLKVSSSPHQEEFLYEIFVVAELPDSRNSQECRLSNL